MAELSTRKDNPGARRERLRLPPIGDPIPQLARFARSTVLAARS